MGAPFDSTSAVADWAAEWYSKNLLDGINRHLLRNGDCIVQMFKTRRETREFIKREYGYIKHRKNLRSEPHGWRSPRPVRVEVKVVRRGR